MQDEQEVRRIVKKGFMEGPFRKVQIDERIAAIELYDHSTEVGIFLDERYTCNFRCYEPDYPRDLKSNIILNYLDILELREKFLLSFNRDECTTMYDRCCKRHIKEGRYIYDRYVLGMEYEVRYFERPNGRRCVVRWPCG